MDSNISYRVIIAYLETVDLKESTSFMIYSRTFININIELTSWLISWNYSMIYLDNPYDEDEALPP